jgi:hypothetical protein
MQIGAVDVPILTNEKKNIIACKEIKLSSSFGLDPISQIPLKLLVLITFHVVQGIGDPI